MINIYFTARFLNEALSCCRPIAGRTKRKFVGLRRQVFISFFQVKLQILKAFWIDETKLKTVILSLWQYLIFLREEGTTGRLGEIFNSAFGHFCSPRTYLILNAISFPLYLFFLPSHNSVNRKDFSFYIKLYHTVVNYAFVYTSAGLPPDGFHRIWGNWIGSEASLIRA